MNESHKNLLSLVEMLQKQGKNHGLLKLIVFLRGSCVQENTPDIFQVRYQD